MRTLLAVAVLFAAASGLATVILDGNVVPLVQLVICCTVFIIVCGLVAQAFEAIERWADRSEE